MVQRHCILYLAISRHISEYLNSVQEDVVKKIWKTFALHARLIPST